MIPHNFIFFGIQPELEATCLGAALRLALPMIVGQKMTKYFELIKPMIEFKFETIQSHGNNVFELATQDEIDKLGSASKGESSKGQFTDDIDLDEVLKYMQKKCFADIVLVLFISLHKYNYIHMLYRTSTKPSISRVKWSTLRNGNRCYFLLVRL